MAASEDPSHAPPPRPLSPFDPTGQLFFGFQPPPPLPAGFPDAQNHDRLMDQDTVPPLPPMPPIEPQPTQPSATVPTEAPATIDEPSNADDRPANEDGSDHSESEDEDDQHDHFRWTPLEEDKTVASEDEIAWMMQKGERSAEDHAYWEKKTFYDLSDKDLVPGESGRIDYLVEHFNGTKENPNKEYVMRSDIVSIGGYDWRIKFYPRGNDTDYLSLYIENVTMQAADFEGTEDFSELPLPLLEGADKLKKRKAVCAQICMVMYNPAEPRSFEYRREAHQFTKTRADFGWPQFTYESRRHFLLRTHHQRQSILRDDQLAFSAYIRIIHDPTGCLWANDSARFDESVTLTGLRPFSPHMAWFAAQLPLLHFAPIRRLLYKHNDSRIVFWLQTLLYKMMTRRHSTSYGGGTECLQSDTIAWLRFLARRLRRETNANSVDELLGTLDPDDGAAIASNRLKTKQYSSVQKAIDNHKTKLSQPIMLALELQRSEYDKEKRQWEKLTNKVVIEDPVTVDSTRYTLYAFATHCGDLESNRFNTYVRPNGPSKPWYRYSEGKVTCLTHKQAVDKHRGFDEVPIPPKLRRHSHHRADHSFLTSLRYEDPREVAHALIYVREDHVSELTNANFEQWEVPLNVREGEPPKDDLVEESELPTSASEPVPEAEEAVVAGAQQPPAGAEEPHTEELHTEEVIIEEHLSDDEARRASIDMDAGYATPNCWLMDGEDVIMSDADSDTTPDADTAQLGTAEEGSDDKGLETVTIDILGREYYHGQMLHGVYHGHGHLITMNGDQYTGPFQHNLKAGSDARMVYAHTGNIYEGDFLDDLPHGHGILTEASTGNVFEGGFKEGKKHGEFVLKGTVTDEDKGCCSICYERDINTAFYDCGHVVACKECAGAVENCPVCRRRVVARLELFGVKMSVE